MDEMRQSFAEILIPVEVVKFFVGGGITSHGRPHSDAVVFSEEKPLTYRQAETPIWWAGWCSVYRAGWNPLTANRF
jgi:hypothetical protein